MSAKRVYLFGIGSPSWQRAMGQSVNPLGVPIAVGKSARKLIATPATTFGFSTSGRRRKRRRRRAG